MASVVRWDSANLRHLLVDNGWRGITPEEVEEVLRARGTELRRRRGGRILASGRTATGRRLTVVYERPEPGIVRPITAWEN